MDKCVVCNEAPHKYKCPSCSAKYCSVSCYKKHKVSPKIEAGCGVSVVSEAPSSLPPLPKDPVVEEERGIVLTDEQFGRIAESDELCSKLRDERLQTLIRGIDGADDREVALADLLASDDDFANAMREMVSVVLGETRLE